MTPVYLSYSERAHHALEAASVVEDKAILHWHLARAVVYALLAIAVAISVAGE